MQYTKKLKITSVMIVARVFQKLKISQENISKQYMMAFETTSLIIVKRVFQKVEHIFNTFSIKMFIFKMSNKFYIFTDNPK